MKQLLCLILSIDIVIFAYCTAKYFANIASKPYIDSINDISEMDISLGQKMERLNKIRD